MRIEKLFKKAFAFLAGAEKKPSSFLDPSELVIRVANELDISEFEIFLRAYEWWFGRRPREDQIEQAFREYLEEDLVPPFVTQYAREILSS